MAWTQRPSILQPILDWCVAGIPSGDFPRLSTLVCDLESWPLKSTIGASTKPRFLVFQGSHVCCSCPRDSHIQANDLRARCASPEGSANTRSLDSHWAHYFDSVWHSVLWNALVKCNTEVIYTIIGTQINPGPFQALNSLYINSGNNS